jgi:alpha-tubulin suppressor-like RCC1 family protein
MAGAANTRAEHLSCLLPSPGTQITAACGSGVASFALASDGALFSFGSSKRGQLGLGAGRLAAPRPQRVPLPAPAAQVAAGWGHAVALLRDGRLYSWGWPAAGRLGHSFAASGKGAPLCLCSLHRP